MSAMGQVWVLSFLLPAIGCGLAPELGSALGSVDACAARADDRLAECIDVDCDEHVNDADCELAASSAYDDAELAFDAFLDDYYADEEVRPQSVIDLEDCKALAEASCLDGANVPEQVEQQVSADGLDVEIGPFTLHLTRDDLEAVATWWTDNIACLPFKAFGKMQCEQDFGAQAEADGAELAAQMATLEAAQEQYVEAMRLCGRENARNDRNHKSCVGSQLGEGYGDHYDHFASGCYQHAQDEYDSCRGECPGTTDTACTPSTMPEHVNCGVWKPTLDSAGTCECSERRVDGAECHLFRRENRQNLALGYGCTPQVRTSEQPYVLTYVVQYDDTGAPDGFGVHCLPLIEGTLNPDIPDSLR